MPDTIDPDASPLTPEEQERQDAIDSVKRRVGQTTLSDDQIFTIYEDNNENPNCAAAVIWAEKAGSVGDLMDIQEGSSRRNLSQLAKQAEDRANFFSNLCRIQTGEGDATQRPSKTIPIVRP